MVEEQTVRQCFYCGWTYDQALGHPESGIAPGTPFDDIPDDWRCPNCGATKAEFAGVAA